MYEADSPERIWFSISRQNEDFLLRFNRCGDFLVKPASRMIVCTPVHESDDHTLHHLLLNQVIPRLLAQLGETVLHASAVSLKTNDIAIAFIGESGVGKSTLAAWFCRKGASLLTDDCLRIVSGDDHPALAIPSYPTIRIWGDSRDQLVSDIEPKPSPTKNSYNNKLQFLNEELPFEYCDSPAPLTAIFLLTPHSCHKKDIEIYKTSQKELVRKMISNCFRLDIKDPSILKNEFERLTNLAINVPAFTVSYPKEWDRIDELHSRILNHINANTLPAEKAIT
ncbi:MAG: hypothetical protein GXP30_03780 [Verrucomicrobia bacterium]|nr:hypothetical protein [Verrucomicrobiota bacterium]